MRELNSGPYGEAHERALVGRLITGLQALPGVQLWGITDPARFDLRVPTVSFTSDQHSPDALATHLGEAGVYVWGGHHYAIPVTDALGLGPSGTLRIGLLHYNTEAEVDRCLDVLDGLLRPGA